MEAAATLTLSSTIQINPFRVFTCTGHKPTITINPRNRTMTLFPHGHLQVIMCGHKSGHAAHAVVRACREMNGDHDGKRARGVVGPTVVLACVLGTMCLTLPMSRPSLANAVPWPFPWSVQEETRAIHMHGSTSTLETLMNVNMEKPVTIKTEEVLAAQKFLEKATADIINAPDKSQPKLIDLADLQENARKLAFSGKTAEELGEALNKTYKILKKKGSYQEAYNFGLVLVEMLIYQGKYVEANELVEQVEKLLPSPSNADPKLYKAVIDLMYMLGKKESAYKFWKEYADEISHGPQDQPVKQVTFQEFKQQIKKLRQKTEGKG